mmetsp:Transcript_49230/g.141501  ORF Transcript_49230/g.141501 Transcript_49230/m.141501 type:complete len:660 (+) Transcript_49230:115-2094(+)
MATAATRHAALLLATLSYMHRAWAAATKAAAPDEVAAAFASGDECGVAGADEGACSLNALQMRRATSRRQAAGAGAGYEAMPKHTFGWVQKRRCHGAEFHELSFVVRHSNMEELRSMAQDRTNPDSPSYRQWLTRAEVKDRFGNEDAARKVAALLDEHEDVSVVHVSDEGEMVTARAPISAWESLLSTEFHEYTHEERDESILRAREYQLPDHLSGNVEAVLNALDYETLMRGSDVPKSPDLTGVQAKGRQFGFGSLEELREAKGGVITPKVLQERYGVPPAAPRGSSGAEKQGATWQVVYATLGQFWSPSDRAHFQRAMGIPDDNYVQQIAGELEGNAKSGDGTCRENPGDCMESNLDVQYMMGVAPWAKIGYWYVPKANAKGMASFLNDFLARFLHTDSVPHVISISYGMPEFSVTKGSLSLFETMMMKLALRGVTVVVASGDDGAASFFAKQKLNGEECWSVKAIGLQACWPASSPWVTAVGGTMGAEVGKEEVACSTNDTWHMDEGSIGSLITTGGGYSTEHTKPDYQNSTHEESGRGIPDIALAAHGYAIVIGERWLTVDGTSASSPAFAGMISLINAELIAQGKPTVGLLNPVLYKESSKSIFTDVTKGDNRCASLNAPCCGGYDAGPGWDPVTGLGVPDFKKLQSAILAASP